MNDQTRSHTIVCRFPEECDCIDCLDFATDVELGVVDPEDRLPPLSDEDVAK